MIALTAIPLLVETRESTLRQPSAAQRTLQIYKTFPPLILTAPIEMTETDEVDAGNKTSRARAASNMTGLAVRPASRGRLL